MADNPPMRSGPVMVASPRPMVPGGRPMHAGPLQGGGGGGLTAKDFMQLLRKRKWLVLVCLLFFTGASVVATILWRKYAPMYTATAYLEVQPSQRQLGYEMPGFDTYTPGLEDRLRTHAELVSNVTVLNAAMEDKDVKETVWYKQDPVTAPLRLKDDLKVTPRQKTSLIAVEVTSTNPKTSATLATAVARAYEEDVQNSTQRQFDSHLNQLGRQKEALETTINDLTAQISRMAGTSAMQEQLNKWGVLVRQLTMQELELVGQLREATNSVNRLVDLQANDALAEAPEVMARLNADPTYGQLLRQAADAANTYQSLLDTYNPEHPTVQDVARRVQRIQQELATRESLATEGIVNEARGWQAQLADNLQATRDDREAANREQSRISANIVQQNFLNLKLEAADKELATVNHNIAQTRIGLDRERPVFLRQPAQPPEKPSQPQPVIVIVGGVLLGIAVGLGLALLLEAVDTSIKRPSDIRRRVDLPLLGVIPHVSDLEEDIEDVYLAMNSHPDSPFGEAFRQIRTRLIFSGPVSEQRSLLVTSPSPEDGRTVITTNLGETMAQAGSRVLLVDANFRQPMLHKIFPGCPTDGLTNALVDQSTWRDLVHEVESNLHVMSSGPMPPNPAELLGSSHMRQLISEMTDRYDRVLFDSGPCLVVTDPAVLAVLVEGVILTIRAGVNSQGMAQRARNIMHEASGRILGVVLNGVRAMPGGYLRKNYETFYEYRERQSLPA